MKLTPYGPHRSRGKQHAQTLKLPGIQVWFSYEDPIAFEAPGGGLVMLDPGNRTPTTLGHMGWIGEPKTYADDELFNTLINRALKGERP